MSDRDPRKMAAQIAGVRAAETYLPKNWNERRTPGISHFPIVDFLNLILQY